MNRLITFTFGNTTSIRELFYFYKINNVVFFTYSSDMKNIPMPTGSTDLSGTYITTIPDEFCPVHRFLSTMSPNYSASLQFSIYENGKIYIYNYGNPIGNDWVATRISGAYITK